MGVPLGKNSTTFNLTKQYKQLKRREYNKYILIKQTPR